MARGIVAAALWCLALALVAGCARTKRVVPEVVAGAFDASAWSPSQTPAVALEGAWSAAWGPQREGFALLEGDTAPAATFRMPGAVAEQAPEGAWPQGQGRVALGVRLRNLPTNQELALFVPVLWSSSLRCRALGAFEVSRTDGFDAATGAARSLAPYALDLPRAKDVDCVLTYVVAPPIEDWRSFFAEAPVLARASEAHAMVSAHRAKYAGIVAFMLTLATYFLVQWLVRRQDIAPRNLAFMLASASVWMLGYGAVFEAVDAVPFLVRRRVEFAFVGFVAASAPLAVRGLMGGRLLRREVVFSALGLLAAIATLLAPTRHLAHALYILVQPAAALSVGWVTLLSVRSIVDRDAEKERRLVAFGALVPALLGVVDLGLARAFDLRMGLTALGFVALSATMAVSIARRNARAHRSAEIFAERSARFVPREFLQALGHDDLTTVALGDARERAMTVLFADLRGFTAMSEHLSPAETFAFLNGCFARLGPPIREHGGFVDKYIGDAIMALFPEDPAQAVRAALAMQKALADIVPPRGGAGRVGLGVGVHLGRVMMGTIGEVERFEATVISDAVNLASRLESFTKQMGCSLVISGAIAHELPDDLVPHIRELGRFAVKGRAEPVTMVEVFALDPVDLRRSKYDSKVRFMRGIEAFLAGDFESAADAFGRIVDECPEDGPAHWWFVRSMREISAEAPRSTRRFVQIDDK